MTMLEIPHEPTIIMLKMILSSIVQIPIPLKINLYRWMLLNNICYVNEFTRDGVLDKFLQEYELFDDSKSAEVKEFFTIKIYQLVKKTDITQKLSAFQTWTMTSRGILPYREPTEDEVKNPHNWLFSALGQWTSLEISSDRLLRVSTLGGRDPKVFTQGLFLAECPEVDGGRWAHPQIKGDNGWLRRRSFNPTPVENVFQTTLYTSTGVYAAFKPLWRSLRLTPKQRNRGEEEIDSSRYSGWNRGGGPGSSSRSFCARDRLPGLSIPHEIIVIVIVERKPGNWPSPCATSTPRLTPPQLGHKQFVVVALAWGGGRLVSSQHK